MHVFALVLKLKKVLWHTSKFTPVLCLSMMMKAQNRGFMIFIHEEY